MGRVGCHTMRVGLVLGAGGVIGGAWLMGALEALEAETGWRAADAEQIVGTSAGAVIGALAAAGVPPEYMSAYATGETLDDVAEAEERAAATARRASAGDYHLQWGFPPIGPGSWRLAMSTLLQPHRHSPAALIAGWLPRGVVSTAAIRAVVDTFVGDEWPDRFWAVAADYGTGRRVAFGRDDAPGADLADAVAASCAIPGFYYPVTIDGRRYVDGGLWSTSNLDILRNERLDLVICLNPTSSLHPPLAWNPVERTAAATRTLSGRRLGSEAKKLRAKGTGVVLVQPTSEDLDQMGPNLMSRRNPNPVIETAIRTVGEQLREPGNRELLEGLPQGDPYKVRRPDGPPSTWPADLLPGQRASAAA